MKNNTIRFISLSSALTVSAFSAPADLPASFVSDLSTTASNFGTGSLAIWGSVALAVIAVVVFRKIFT